MKEWALKHPWMTFLLVSSAIEGVVKLVYVLTGGTRAASTEEEDSEKSVETEEEA